MNVLAMRLLGGRKRKGGGRKHRGNVAGGVCWVERGRECGEKRDGDKVKQGRGRGPKRERKGKRSDGV